MFFLRNKLSQIKGWIFLNFTIGDKSNVTKCFAFFVHVWQRCRSVRPRLELDAYHCSGVAVALVNHFDGRSPYILGLTFFHLSSLLSPTKQLLDTSRCRASREEKSQKSREFKYPKIILKSCLWKNNNQKNIMFWFVIDVRFVLWFFLFK